jgi:hypothetical protein
MQFHLAAKTRRFVLTLLPILAIMPTAKAESSGKPTVDLGSHPLGGNAPISIGLGLYVEELGPVDEADEDFEIQGYVYASWHDDRLIAIRDRSATRGVQRAPRWAFPLGYALVVAALIPMFFIGRGHPL